MKDMTSEKSRLASFVRWPLPPDCKVTPAAMARAGFFHCPTDDSPDLVQCFSCAKGLDGWDPQDDPIAEHKKHAPTCAYIATLTVAPSGPARAVGTVPLQQRLPEIFADLPPLPNETVEDYLKRRCDAESERLVAAAEALITRFAETARATRSELEGLVA